MSNTSSNFEMAGVLLGKEVRKRKTPQEKIAIIQQTMEPGRKNKNNKTRGLLPEQNGFLILIGIYR
ncbi:hypothetical protein [Escherichia coli]|uniref:hypothetical protein n=1 Tax=Escherichia coli TaxID=562 RepID=UPI001E445901|nr:hypothetical protein [Escherichia coli]